MNRPGDDIECMCALTAQDREVPHSGHFEPVVTKRLHPGHSTSSMGVSCPQFGHRGWPTPMIPPHLRHFLLTPGLGSAGIEIRSSRVKGKMIVARVQLTQSRPLRSARIAATAAASRLIITIRFK